MNFNKNLLICGFLLCNIHTQAQSYFYKIKHPEIFQGAHQKRRYFEGWYFKSISADTLSSWAIIPGIAIDKKGIIKSFIQLINGKNAETIYLEFTAKDFQYSKDSLDISIDKNSFSLKQLHLDIQKDGHQINADLKLSDHAFLPKHSLLSANVMGPFAFLPMQCKHGIISMNHIVNGHLTIDGKTYLFKDGKGYIEKDWGHSFPEKHVWFQSNHFKNPKTSLSISIASIPHFGFSFTGFLAVLYSEGKYYQFYTYNHSTIKVLEVTKDAVHIELKKRNKRLIIDANRQLSGDLQAPNLGDMDRKLLKVLMQKLPLSYINVIN
jgi:hypothetical protein